MGTEEAAATSSKELGLSLCKDSGPCPPGAVLLRCGCPLNLFPSCCPSSTPLLTLTNVYSGGTAQCLCFPRLQLQPQGTTEPSKCGCCARRTESFISVHFKKPLVASSYCIARCNSKPTTKPPKLITLSIPQED